MNAVALQSDGKIIAGGNISRYQAPASGSPQTSLKRLNPDGSLDTTTTFNTTFNTTAATLADAQGQTEVNKILTVADDKLYVGGVFTSYQGTNRSGVMRLNADGSLDTAFNVTGITNSNSFGSRFVLALAEQADGKLLVGGFFTHANGTYRASLARFNPDGSLDTAFNPNATLANCSVHDIALLPNGQILVAGARPRAGGGGVPLLSLLNPDGSLDPSVSTPFADEFGDIDELLLMPDGRIIIGGDFTFVGSGTNYNIAGLVSTGALDTAFMANLGAGPSGWVGGELVLQPDGTILAGGIFKSWNNQPRASIARIFPDGTLDTAFAPPPYINDNSYLTHFYSFAVQPDGKLVAGGWLARVSDPAVETYNLTRFVNEFSTGPGTLRALSPALTTTENAGSVALSVSRFGGLIGAVSVNYTLTPLTAVPGTDYTPVSGTLTWATGVGGVQTITVPILQDAAQDGLKAFQLNLSDPTGGATLPPANATTLVGIRDDDAPPVIVLDPVAVTLDQGANFSLVVFYESVLPATVQWQRDPDGPGGPLPYENVLGATSLVYLVNTANPATHSGFYRAVVSNPNGATQSAAAEVAIAVPAGSVVTTTSTVALSSSILAATLDSTQRPVLLTAAVVSPASQAQLRRLRRNASDASLIETDPTFTTASFNSVPAALLIQNDGRILVGGFFSQVNGLASTAFARFSADGVYDSAYAPSLPAFSGTGYAQTLAPGEPTAAKFYVGFGAGGGLRRYLATGAHDTTFVPPATIGQGNNGIVHAVRELADGTVLVAHQDNPNFSTINYRLSRLTSTGTFDPTFGTGGSVTLTSYLTALDVLPDGRIAITARFSSALSPTQQYIGLLTAAGAPDPDFVSTGLFNNSPLGVSYRDGRLLVWGNFSTVNGTTQGGLARLNLDGSVDASLSVGVGAAGVVNSALTTGPGDIFIAGDFTSFKGVARNRFAYLVGNPLIGAVGFAPSRVTAVVSSDNYKSPQRQLKLPTPGPGKHGSETVSPRLPWGTGGEKSPEGI